MIQEMLNMLFILIVFNIFSVVVCLLCSVPAITKFIMKDRRKYDIEVYKVNQNGEFLVETYDNKPKTFLDNYR